MTKLEDISGNRDGLYLFVPQLRHGCEIATLATNLREHLLSSYEIPKRPLFDLFSQIRLPGHSLYSNNASWHRGNCRAACQRTKTPRSQPRLLYTKKHSCESDLVRCQQGDRSDKVDIASKFENVIHHTNAEL
jgi:hypothetical protein